MGPGEVFGDACERRQRCLDGVDEEVEGEERMRSCLDFRKALRVSECLWVNGEIKS